MLGKNINRKYSLKAMMREAYGIGFIPYIAIFSDSHSDTFSCFFTILYGLDD